MASMLSRMLPKPPPAGVKPGAALTAASVVTGVLIARPRPVLTFPAKLLAGRLWSDCALPLSGRALGRPAVAGLHLT